MTKLNELWAARQGQRFGRYDKHSQSIQSQDGSVDHTAEKGETVTLPKFKKTGRECKRGWPFVDKRRNIFQYVCICKILFVRCVQDVYQDHFTCVKWSWLGKGWWQYRILYQNKKGKIQKSCKNKVYSLKNSYCGELSQLTLSNDCVSSLAVS